MAEITEDFILKRTKEQRLEKIIKLNLTGLSMTELPDAILMEMTHLDTLDVSGNDIESISQSFTSKKLRILDVSDNLLTSVDFLKNFPNLLEFYMDGNPGLGMADRYIVTCLYPHIEKCGKTSRESLTRMVDHYDLKLRKQILAVWEDEFSRKYSDWELPNNRIKSIADALTEKVKQSKPYGAANMTKFRDFMINQIAVEIVNDVNNGTYEPPMKKKKISVKHTQIKKKRDDKKRNMLSSDANAVAMLPDAPDFSPVNFVRCHFNDREEKDKCKDNDPRDEHTKVWVCKFEPDLNDSAKTTGLVATCGGDCVCILDTGTGSVVKRYKVEKDQFYSLAWTTLTMGDEDKSWKTNILAVGCYRGKIKLIQPGQGVCYAEWGNGKPNRRMTGDYYISNMIFHPTKKTWLFAGGSDASITLFDIGIPKGENYDSTHQQRLVLITPDNDDPIYSLVYSPNTEHLVAGCRYGCYAWSVDMGDNLPHKNSKKQPSCEVLLPGGTDEPSVDALTLITDDIVASKCVDEGCIFLWSFGQTLDGKGKKNGCVKAAALMCLQWSATSTEYLSFGYNNGLLACGDAKGQILMYNIGPLLPGILDNPYKEMSRPSRIIEWPDCEITSQREEEKQMTDVLDTPDPLVINMVAFSSDAERMVCVTDCNLVCFWKQDHGATTPMELGDSPNT